MEILGLLESAIGLVLIYLVLSLICSAWVEGIVNWTGLRGENLRELLKVMTGGNEEVANLLLAQPQLRSLFAPERKPEGWRAIVWHRLAYLAKRAAALFWDKGRSQKEEGFRPPSYIPPSCFARALCELAMGESPDHFAGAPELLERRLSEGSILERLQTSLTKRSKDGDIQVASAGKERGEIHEKTRENNPDPEVEHAAIHLSEVLNRLWAQSGGNPEEFLAEVEQWFEDGTDRAAGWFKRKLAPKLFAVGMVVALALNVDTLQILSRLSSDPELRRYVVETAVDKVDEQAPRATVDSAERDFNIEFRRAKEELLQLEPLLGWRASSLPEEEERDGWDWLWWTLSKLIGLLVTAIALSLGAPFWFDVLQKLVRIRASVSQADVEKRDAERERRSTESGANGPSAPAAVLPAPSTGVREDAAEQARLVSGMVGLAPAAEAPDRMNARWMAELASLVYTEDRNEVEQALKRLGLKLDGSLDKREMSLSDGVKAIDTQAFVASSQDLVVVAFRGTEVEAGDPADILTDAQVSKQPLDWFERITRDGPCPRAHHGFVEALEAVWKNLWDDLVALATAGPGRPIWFVGHSLGGALAVLAAIRYAIERDVENKDREQQAEDWLKELDPDADDATVAKVHRRIRREASPLPPVGWIYTIGQPAVGDECLAEWLEGRFGRRLVRVVNNRDVVPRLPSPLIGYAHAGAELYIDSFGRMRLEPSDWYRGLDTLVIDPEWARQRVRETIDDHKAETYIALLKGRS
jgi:hypothetical protein